MLNMPFWCRMLTGDDLGDEAILVPDVDRGGVFSAEYAILVPDVDDHGLSVPNTPFRCRMLTSDDLGDEAI